MPNAPSQSLDKFIVRMPGDLRDRIKRAADRSGRSMNAEITAVLERQYPPEKADMTLAELSTLIEWVQDVSTREELSARQADANARLASTGYELRWQSGRDGRLVLGLSTTKSVPGLLDPLTEDLERIVEKMQLAR